jgi:hypothetical protein
MPVVSCGLDGPSQTAITLHDSFAIHPGRAKRRWWGIVGLIYRRAVCAHLAARFDKAMPVAIVSSISTE